MNDLIDTTEMYLRTIYELEEEGVVPLRARIAERLGQSGPTVSQTVARMERDGLIARQAHPSDRRASVVMLTAKAKARFPEAKKRLTENANAAVAGFSDEEKATLMAMLQRVVQNLDEELEPLPTNARRRR